MLMVFARCTACVWERVGVLEVMGEVEEKGITLREASSEEVGGELHPIDAQTREAIRHTGGKKPEREIGKTEVGTV